MSDRLEKALEAAKETKACLIGEDVLEQLPSLFHQQFGKEAEAFVIADPRTWKVAGERVASQLHADSILLEDEGLYAEMKYVDRLSEALTRHPHATPIAVGSGTINDLTKLASGRAGKAYIVVGTAASMDGYASYGASITYRGAKQTFSCPAPQVIIADLAIIKQAPREMTASGYADLFSKIVAGADWILADELGVEPIDPCSWSIVQEGLPDALGNPEALREGDTEAYRKFVEGLMLGGFAMQWARSSRPASGAEHQFSHLWDMEHHIYRGKAPSHGFKVGVGTHFIAGLYERLLAFQMERLDVDAACERWLEWPQAEARARKLYEGSDFPELGVVEIREKYVSRSELREQLNLLKRVWPSLRKRLTDQLLPQEEVRRRLRCIGAPVEPEEIGITPQRMKESILKAQHIRRRFTILDVALRIGLI